MHLCTDTSTQIHIKRMHCYSDNKGDLNYFLTFLFKFPHLLRWRSSLFPIAMTIEQSVREFCSLRYFCFIMILLRNYF